MTVDLDVPAAIHQIKYVSVAALALLWLEGPAKADLPGPAKS